MQLHAGRDRGWSIQHACRMLGQNCIALDDSNLHFSMKHYEKAKKALSKDNHQSYLKFCHDMEVGDFVLIAPPSAPLALCIVASDYIYDDLSRATAGIVFRHLRLVRSITSFGDVFKRKEWPIGISVVRAQSARSKPRRTHTN